MKLNKIFSSASVVRRAALSTASDSLIGDSTHTIFEQNTEASLAALPLIANRSEIDALCSDIKRNRNFSKARQVPFLLLSIHDIKRVTDHLATHDIEFQQHVRSGDNARDQNNWSDAEFSFWSALRLYPFHSGYTVQYAHCLKEQGKFSDSECFYRQAIALGEPLDLVMEHLHYVVDRAHSTVNNRTMAHIQASWSNQGVTGLSAPPTIRDIEVATELLTNNRYSLPEINQMMNRFPSREEFILGLICESNFSKVHRNLMQLIAETNWGQ